MIKKILLVLLSLAVAAACTACTTVGDVVDTTENIPDETTLGTVDTEDTVDTTNTPTDNTNNNINLADVEAAFKDYLDATLGEDTEYTYGVNLDSSQECVILVYTLYYGNTNDFEVHWFEATYSDGGLDFVCEYDYVCNSNVKYESNTPEWRVETANHKVVNEASSFSHILYTINIYGPNGEEYTFYERLQFPEGLYDAVSGVAITDENSLGFAEYEDARFDRKLIVHPSYDYALLVFPVARETSADAARTEIKLINLKTGKLVETPSAISALYDTYDDWREGMYEINEFNEALGYSLRTVTEDVEITDTGYHITVYLHEWNGDIMRSAELDIDLNYGDNSEITQSDTDFPEPPLSEYELTMSVPEFLDEEQQMLYRKARNVYMHVCGNSTASVEYEETLDYPLNNYESFQNERGWRYMISQGRYQKWDDFTALVYSVFTEDFFNSRNTSPAFIEYNGKLVFLDADKGGVSCYNYNFDDKFRLVSKTDTEIVFELIAHYSYIWPREGESFDERDARVAAGWEWTDKFTIRMVLTDAGWRFDEFYNPAVDEHKWWLTASLYEISTPLNTLCERVCKGEISYGDILKYKTFENAVAIKISETVGRDIYWDDIAVFTRDNPRDERYPYAVLLSDNSNYDLLLEAGPIAAQIGDEVEYCLEWSYPYHVYGRYVFGDEIIDVISDEDTYACINKTKLLEVLDSRPDIEGYTIEYGSITLCDGIISVPLNIGNASVLAKVRVSDDLSYSMLSVEKADGGDQFDAAEGLTFSFVRNSGMFYLIYGNNGEIVLPDTESDMSLLMIDGCFVPMLPEKGGEGILVPAKAFQALKIDIENDTEYFTLGEISALGYDVDTIRIYKNAVLNYELNAVVIETSNDEAKYSIDEAQRIIYDRLRAGYDELQRQIDSGELLQSHSDGSIARILNDAAELTVLSVIFREDFGRYYVFTTTAFGAKIYFDRYTGEIFSDEPVQGITTVNIGSGVYNLSRAYW